jgi:hypothetical protein
MRTFGHAKGVSLPDLGRPGKQEISRVAALKTQLGKLEREPGREEQLELRRSSNDAAAIGRGE